ESSIQSVGDIQDIENILDSVVQFRNEVRINAINSPQAEKDLEISDNLKKQRPSKDVTLLKACDSLRDNLLLTGVKIKDHGKMSTWTYSKRDNKRNR
ncbi:hypothetical protein L9F63_003188, partial [Diploptera punctata]